MHGEGERFGRAPRVGRSVHGEGERVEWDVESAWRGREIWESALRGNVCVEGIDYGTRFIPPEQRS